MSDYSRSDNLILNLDLDSNFSATSSVSVAMLNAEQELASLDENIETLSETTVECDKSDYVLSACSGLLCGIIDVFLVGKPGESPIGNLTDQWFADRTKDFAKLCKWDSSKDDSLKSAIQHLENKFKIPYDQTSPGPIGKDYLDLNTFNHHFKSLAHNPTLVGLFFSILDQFGETVNGQYRPTSHFVDNGTLVTVSVYDSSFELRGKNVPAKLFCGIVNWFGHLISDQSGSHSSKGRGMGIPSPVMSWTNSIIVIKQSLKIPSSSFDKQLNELAQKLFVEGFDMRFQTAQLIPVFLNECIVRLFYCTRRLVKYFSNLDSVEDFSFHDLWETCKPFNNNSIKRILTVAHGVFCLVDVGDATIRGFATGGGSFNVSEFFLRVNIAGVGRFAICIVNEINMAVDQAHNMNEAAYLSRKRVIVSYYLDGLKELAVLYDDRDLVSFVDDFKEKDLYREAFQKSVELAKKRKVPEEKILKSKEDIDSYFLNGD